MKCKLPFPVCAACLFTLSIEAQAQQPAPAEAQKPTILKLQTAVQFALESNPALAVQRKQRGIAAARVVIAETYPFNPTLENRIQGAAGPQSAGVTNSVPLENLLLWEVEVRKQGQYRKQGAAAALTRTEWEIAYQEQTLAIEVLRTYMTLVYRREKLKLLEETQRINERLVEDIRWLVNLGKLKSADLIVAQTEVVDALDLVGTGREAVAAGRQDTVRTFSGRGEGLGGQFAEATRSRLNRCGSLNTIK